MRRQDNRLTHKAISNENKHASAPSTPENEIIAGSLWKTTKCQSSSDNAINSNGNRKKTLNRRQTCGKERQFATAYAKNSHGESGVQNGIYGPATVPSIGSMANAA